MFEHLDDLVKERGRPFETYKEAADYGQEYLKQLAKDRRRKNKGAAEPLHQTIQEKISKQRPDLAIDYIGEYRLIHFPIPTDRARSPIRDKLRASR